MSPRSHVPWFLLMGHDSQSTVWVWRLALPYSSRSSQRFLKPRLLKPACSGTHAGTVHTQSGIHGQLTLSVPRLFLLRDSQSNPKAFVLTLCHHQKIKNFQILPVSTDVFTLMLTLLCSGFVPHATFELTTIENSKHRTVSSSLVRSL